MTDDTSDPTWQGADSPATLGRTNPDGTMWHRSVQLARRSLLWLVPLAFGAVACAEDKPLNTFEPRGPQADDILSLTWPLWAIMAFFFVFVVIGGIVLTIRQRVKPEDYDPEDLPAQTHGNPTLEWGWTAAPAILLAVLAIPSARLIWELEEKNDDHPQELDVMVVGRQWWWEYRYDVDGDGFFDDADGDGEIFGPNGEGGDSDDTEWPLHLALDDDDLSVANELVIPADVQVDLWITSNDVIHSYWIPRLNGKRDAVPGRFHTWSIAPYEPGKYTGWCTEFCGLSHARMRMSVVALPEAEYEEWFERQLQPAETPTEEEALLGMELFNAQCVTCHTMRSDSYTTPDDWESASLKAGAAPDMTHFASRSVFAGAIYGQYITDGSGQPYDPNDDDLDVSSYLELSENGRLNVAQLKRWISNAPSQKDMDPDDLRGMPAFPALSEEDLDHLVAYLATLD